MRRRTFIKHTSILGAGMLDTKVASASPTPDFPIVRIAANQRHFRSKAIDAAIQIFQSKVKNPELNWLFENCFPNTLDTTVYYKEENEQPDTYVITGDIDAMWLRDSSAQVWPYLQFVNEDAALKRLIAGVIRHQTKNCIRLLQNTHAGAGFMHEFFHKDDPAKFSRDWFAWSNTLFGELLWKTHQEMPQLLTV